jgi:hypothetical protein
MEEAWSPRFRGKAQVYGALWISALSSHLLYALMFGSWI